MGAYLVGPDGVVCFDGVEGKRIQRDEKRLCVVHTTDGRRLTYTVRELPARRHDGGLIVRHIGDVTSERRANGTVAVQEPRDAAVEFAAGQWVSCSGWVEVESVWEER